MLFQRKFHLNWCKPIEFLLLKLKIELKCIKALSICILLVLLHKGMRIHEAKYRNMENIEYKRCKWNYLCCYHWHLTFLYKRIYFTVHSKLLTYNLLPTCNMLFVAAVHPPKRRSSTQRNSHLAFEMSSYILQ